MPKIFWHMNGKMRKKFSHHKLDKQKQIDAKIITRKTTHKKCEKHLARNSLTI